MERRLDDEKPEVIKAVAKIIMAIKDLPRERQIKILRLAMAIDDARRRNK